MVRMAWAAAAGRRGADGRAWCCLSNDQRAEIWRGLPCTDSRSCPLTWSRKGRNKGRESGAGATSMGNVRAAPGGRSDGGQRRSAPRGGAAGRSRAGAGGRCLRQHRCAGGSPAARRLCRGDRRPRGDGGDRRQLPPAHRRDLPGVGQRRLPAGRDRLEPDRGRGQRRGVRRPSRGLAAAIGALDLDQLGHRRRPCRCSTATAMPASGA